MQADLPPVYVGESTNYQHFKEFANMDEAIDFIHKHGGVLVQGSLSKPWIVIHIPAKEVIVDQVTK